MNMMTIETCYQYLLALSNWYQLHTLQSLWTLTWMIKIYNPVKTLLTNTSRKQLSTSLILKMPLYPQPKFHGPKRTKTGTPLSRFDEKIINNKLINFKLIIIEHSRVELHIHLDGCVRMSTIWELYKQKGKSSSKYCCIWYCLNTFINLIIF